MSTSKDDMSQASKQNETKRAQQRKTGNQNEFFIYALSRWQLGQMAVYKCLGQLEFWNDDENGFSPWSEQSHFTEHIRPREPPVVSFCPRVDEQQVNAAHVEEAAATELIIKEAQRLSACIVSPSRWP